MIYRIYSDLKSFRELRLKPGLNVLLADKSEEATDKQTRNGAGKTSLIELIHFVLGERLEANSIFRAEELAPWRFGLEFDLAGEKVSIERSGAVHGQVLAKSGDIPNLSSKARLTKDFGETIVPNARWKAVLGERVFGLALDKAEERGKFAPTFRSMIPYFARQENDGGFVSHMSHSSRQPPWNQQVAISYLLGLDWTVSQRFQQLREQEKTIAELKRSARHGTLPGFKGSVASLRTQVTLAVSKTRQLKRQLDSFNVVPEYQSIEREATTLTRDINRQANENTADRQLLDQLNNALEDERAPQVSDLEAVYREAGIVLPEMVTRRLDEAIEFHHVIIENRKAHLRSEIDRVRQRIHERDNLKASVGNRRSELMGILKTGGALDHYTVLQEEFSRLQADAEGLKQQLLTAERLESEQIRAEIERRQLQERLRQDFHEQEAVLNEAIVLFEELSEALYERERAGSLTVHATDNGPRFEVSIEAQRSRGINNMQIFCFDIMTSVIAARRGISPGFLIHDSHLFDGVDERQVAKAVQIGRERADECGFQYLITMNSDALPKDGFDQSFDVIQHTVPVKLDDTPKGSLFGVRFN